MRSRSRAGQRLYLPPALGLEVDALRHPLGQQIEPPRSYRFVGLTAGEQHRDPQRRQEPRQRRPPFEREHGDVEPGRPYAERHPHVQVARHPAQQRADHGGGLAALQPFHLVEREHARRAVAVERADQEVEPVRA